MFSTDRSSGDLTAKARIRSAAISLFGRDGYAKTTIRDIAGEAAVSPALIVHHFGGKDGLRAACDAHIVDFVFGISDQFHVVEAGTPSRLREIFNNLDVYRPVLLYIRQMLIAGGEIADKLFARIVDEIEAYLSEEAQAGRMNLGSDPHTMAVVVTAINLSFTMFDRQIGLSVARTPELSNDVLQTISVPVTELLTNGLYTSDSLLQAVRDALTDAPTPPTPTPPTPTPSTPTPHNDSNGDAA